MAQQINVVTFAIGYTGLVFQDGFSGLGLQSIRINSGATGLEYFTPLGSVSVTSPLVNTGTASNPIFRIAGITTAGTSGQFPMSDGATWGYVSSIGTGNVMRAISPTTTGTFTGAASAWSGDMNITKANAAAAFAIVASTGTNAASMVFSNTGSNAVIGNDNSTGSVYSSAAYATVIRGGGSLYMGGGNAFQIVSRGNGHVSIGSATDNGYIFEVTGTGNFTGNLSTGQITTNDIATSSITTGVGFVTQTLTVGSDSNVNVGIPAGWTAAYIRDQDTGHTPVLVMLSADTADTNELGVIYFGTTGASTTKLGAAIKSTLEGSAATHAAAGLTFLASSGVSGAVDRGRLFSDGHWKFSDDVAASPTEFFYVDGTSHFAGNMTGTGISMNSGATLSDIGSGDFVIKSGTDDGGRLGFFGEYVTQEGITETSADPAITEIQDLLISYGLALDDR